LLLMSILAIRNLALAMRVFIDRDDHLVAVVEVNDAKFDELELQIDEKIVTYISISGPIAHDCRRMLVASKIARNLEQVADQVKKIARIARELNAGLPLTYGPDIPLVIVLAQEMLRDSVAAFVDENDDLAAEIINKDRSVSMLLQRFTRKINRYMVENPEAVTSSVRLMKVLAAFDRVTDHATNIAEEVFYLNRGRTTRRDARQQRSVGNLP
jgi:phosphate transport system protein